MYTNRKQYSVPSDHGFGPTPLGLPSSPRFPGPPWQSTADWGCPKRGEVRFLSSGVGGAGSFGGGVGAPAPGLSLPPGGLLAVLGVPVFIFPDVLPVPSFPLLQARQSHWDAPPHPLQRLFLN